MLIVGVGVDGQAFEGGFGGDGDGFELLVCVCEGLAGRWCFADHGVDSRYWWFWKDCYGWCCWVACWCCEVD